MDGTFPSYAYDDDLIAAARRDGRPRVRVYRLKAPVAVLGSGSRPEVELNIDACRSDGLPILRRRGGGCAVLLDPGNVIVSVVATGLPFGRHRACFDTLTAWLIDGLARIGIPDVRQMGICDLTLDDRKIGGACLHRSRDLLYYSASLLVLLDIDAVTRYIAHPPREPDYRSGRPHATFMGSLTSTGEAADADHVASALRQTLEPSDLTLAVRSTSLPQENRPPTGGGAA